ncbi:hypothetical protein AC578_5506 [Pseudocercospora eumusae]|uniref:DH domain-containing protein n=1 Tax=Pseudocercospora eumusae TaxID=321146 RepID=A0A139H7U2_9PEZI|nr:hypothetical protein AC578_5506 [Pseudocercospora eumusae]
MAATNLPDAERDLFALNGPVASAAATADHMHADVDQGIGIGMGIGPDVDPRAHMINTTTATLSRTPAQPSAHSNLHHLSHSRPPSTTQLRSVSGPLPATHTLTSVRSTPVLPSRPRGSTVRDMASRFEHPTLAVNTTREKYRRPSAAAAAGASPGAPPPPKSPVSGSSVEGGKERTRLQKKRPDHLHKSPKKSPSASFDANTSFSSSGTTTSSARTTRSQPHAAFSPKRTKSPSRQVRPLFGEITADGKWNGNFDVPVGMYGPLPTFEKTPRRSSEGSVALHGRSHSHQDISAPFLAPGSFNPKLTHKRSRSDMDAFRPPIAPSMPNLLLQAAPVLYPTPPDSASRIPRNLNSRIPISNSRQSNDSTASSRPASAMSAGHRRKLSKSPTRSTAAKGKENARPASRARYHPAPISTSTNQTLSAKIVAPAPKTSPPLRSSRPRQPVSAATTSASRARAAERFQPNTQTPRDGRRPSEQWLGKPYDPQKERSRRKIPELGKIDFEGRRNEIQRKIAASLKSTESQDSLRSPSRSASRSQTRSASSARVPPHENSAPTTAGAENQSRPSPHHMNADAHDLSVKTAGFLEASNAMNEPLTAQTDRTMFEDDSPVLGRSAATPAHDSPILLSAATYQPPSKTSGPAHAKALPLDVDTSKDSPPQKVQSPSVLDNVLRMRERSESSASRSGTEFADDSLSAEDSHSDLGDKWGLGNGVGGYQGSIRIMLDDDPNIHNPEPWPKDVGRNHFEASQRHLSQPEHDIYHAQQHNQHAFTANGYVESPTDTGDYPDDGIVTTPRSFLSRDDTLRATDYHSGTAALGDEETAQTDDTIARVLDHYQSTGTVTAEMLEQMQHRMVDLHRISANGGSNGIMIQSLLDSILDLSQPREQHTPEKQLLQPQTYEMPTVTPDTPPMDGGFVPGTVIVYGNDAEPEEEDEDDFEAKIRKADEAWERQQRGEDPFAPQQEDDDRPPPPPKDYGYTPRSSIGPPSATYTPLTEAGLRISTTGALNIDDIHAAADRAGLDQAEDMVQSPHSTSAPPLPGHAPPPPPPESANKASFTLPDLAAAKAYSERASSDMSPRFPKLGPSGSSRPSMDSQRNPAGLPGSQSMTSFGESNRQASMDTGVTGSAKKSASPEPETKRLLKRRHTIKELLDTESSYHQDLKIIEDIYKATCTPELVAPDDKKILFGNCDEVEKFALHFYDEMRKAAAQVYVPTKHNRWLNKRGSFSTTQSDNTSSTFSDGLDDDKDRTTAIGRTFLVNLARMEQVYQTYLRNHGAANQRLSAIQSIPTVKCWLDECHANASDITSAWDLDSLLVKPTQRVAKYPMLLQQLLDVTPADHPDYMDLKAAAKDSIAMLTRINDAKKRADLVEQMVNPGKRKESDIRSGLAKAFGRRTEKLKERVGIAEAFQDPDFDELAHKFGGHFIRLQICMRDVQDYMHRTDKAVELVNNYAAALELFTDVSPSALPEIEVKYRKYGQIIRDLTFIAFGEHKADVQKRVLAPMIQCIKLHEGPQNAINKRKKKIVDYAKCKSEERRGQKPDKKTVEAAEMYTALNDQLKLDLPKLYSLTAQLVQNCLHCFIDIQMKWQSTWERKLKPVLEAADIPNSVQQIEPSFHPDFAEIEKRCNQLSICNGTLKIEAANFLSPTIAYTEPNSEASSAKRRTTMDSSKRSLSVTSESSTNPNTRRHSGIYTPGSEMQPPALSSDSRFRSNSALSTAQTPGSAVSANRPWSNSNVATPSSSFSATRPTTAETPSMLPQSYFPKHSIEQGRSTRPTSDATYYTARPAHNSEPIDQHRFSGLFNSALPPELGIAHDKPPSPSRAAPDDMNVLFVCASLFEFSIDKTRKEGGYPYLQYVQGEVFDVVAQKGELWLAKNQDDPTNELGWIWEQHFIILSEEA